MAKKQSKALARRPASRSYPGQSLAPHRSAPKLPKPPAPSVSRVLTDDVDLDTLGLVELKLTAKEEEVLNRPVRTSELRVLPSGQAYLSHPSYTRWFNEAFGRLGWALRPVAKPRVAEKIIIVPYVLYIHGKPVAFAWGEQEYHPNNSRQTYGDATEATVASALRRVAKRLGVGLELWDKPFLDEYVRKECVLVKCIIDGDKSYQWRRRIDKPLRGEVGNEAAGTAEPDTESGQRAHAPATPITEKQLRRLFAILHNSGRNEDLVKEWLKRRYGLEHWKDVSRHDYDAICDAIAGQEKLQ